MNLPPELEDVLCELGFSTPTPIQSQSIPILLAGRDLIGQARTGSGKTLAFSLPLLAKVQLNIKSPSALIICPTRELCAQVAREIRKLGRKLTGLRVITLSGGEPASGQRAALKRGVQVAVGTPGRILDLLSYAFLDLSQLQTLVLDEADRMLEMGFADDIKAILAATPDKRQTVFFSATFPESIASISASFQRNPARVKALVEAAEVPQIRQVLWPVQEDKRAALLHLLKKLKPNSTLVFANHKASVKEISEFLGAEGISATHLSGDLEQFERNREMAKFRNQSVRVLVATDVAARGIDVDDLDLVVNYDLPHKPEIYVHRIGRTGRAAKHGLAVTLALPRDRAAVATLEDFLKLSLERLDLESNQVEPRTEQRHSGAALMTTLTIGGGRKEKIRPGDILGALTGAGIEIAAENIGKIEIHDSFAYVAVAKSVASIALSGLLAGKIKGKKLKVSVVH